MSPVTRLEGHVASTQRGIRRLHAESMSARQEHPVGSPEYLYPQGTPIYKRLANPLRYRQFFLAKALPLCLLISVITDLSIGVPVADTPPMSPLLRTASLL